MPFCHEVRAMKYGDYAELTMKKAMLAGETIDKNVISCRVLRYDGKQECIYLVLEDAQLTDVSLDSVYECQIQTSEDGMACTGIVRERYYNAFGKILEFQIKNGFYKIRIK